MAMKNPALALILKGQPGYSKDEEPKEDAPEGESDREVAAEEAIKARDAGDAKSFLAAIDLIISTHKPEQEEEQE